MNTQRSEWGKPHCDLVVAAGVFQLGVVTTAEDPECDRAEALGVTTS